MKDPLQEERGLAAMYAVKCDSNIDFRIREKDLRPLLTAIETVDASADASARYWYSNGGPPRHRNGLVMLVHPQIHKLPGVWNGICDAAEALAVTHKRWVWVVMTESRWLQVMIAAPGHGAAEQQVYVEVSNQYFHAIQPDGTDGPSGCS